jgi:hypothetical protein
MAFPQSNGDTFLLCLLLKDEVSRSLDSGEVNTSSKRGR